MKRKMLKKITRVFVFILIAFSFQRNVHAAEGAQVAAIVVVGSLYASSVWIPVNIIDGTKNQGKILESSLGIGLGALQVLVGSSVGGITGAATSSEKALGIPLAILGAANIGAGIFSLTHRGPKNMALAPSVNTQDGPKPGFTLSASF